MDRVNESMQPPPSISAPTGVLHSADQRSVKDHLMARTGVGIRLIGGPSDGLFTDYVHFPQVYWVIGRCPEHGYDPEDWYIDQGVEPPSLAEDLLLCSRRGNYRSRPYDLKRHPDLAAFPVPYYWEGWETCSTAQEKVPDNAQP